MHALLFALLAVLAIPSSAFAWGGGTHLLLGTYALNNLSLLPSTIASIIGAYPNDFLYGCLAADITVGKKFTHFLLNCHRWRVGQKVLSHAATDQQKACAYGYLAHLAADTIAHNYYVPLQTIGSFSTLTLKHAYWEVRFDSFVDREIWETGKTVARDHFEDNDELLRSVVASTLFSFGTNKRIFNSIMLLTRLEKWQQAIRTLNEASRFSLEEGERDEFLELSKTAVLDVLGDMEGSCYLAADPTGERAITAAEGIRKNLRLLYRSGKISREDANSQVEEIGNKLRDAICDPDLLREILAAA
ncbi:zinc dependent phospholipase C family protein [Geobacter pelophilus]|uniref:Zinc dependent phospholipase C family protein n=1 Tax=Geoanaerobacter pelophilus TaxID=60036 RepID=A0AAW4KW94_9BACT|nr:zinc dependent phospholipase C family protein [Geoanaerobacter pelophilus]MBT0662836.1 zinc dependent phospholipase C family protein [Geoanaerobacter pelophilus]